MILENEYDMNEALCLITMLALSAAKSTGTIRKERTRLVAWLEEAFNEYREPKDDATLDDEGIMYRIGTPDEIEEAISKHHDLVSPEVIRELVNDHINHNPHVGSELNVADLINSTGDFVEAPDVPMDNTYDLYDSCYIE